MEILGVHVPIDFKNLYKDNLQEIYQEGEK